ncbi:MAG: HAMP domain-containing histidine kinase [Planctomycetia bacterium]|nr:HAMP domain-containing histidine kinase [Planctomycetia bacterium]
MSDHFIRADGAHRSDSYAQSSESAAQHEGAPSGEGPATIELLNLQTVMSAWQDATSRLEQTHAALRSEVSRLSHELAVKNRELARKNRLADLGQIASHVAHEVRNNLVPVSLYAGLLRRRLSDDPGSAEVLEKIQAGLTALDAMVHDMLNFTADKEPTLGIVGVRALVEEVLASLRPQFAAQGIALRLDVATSTIVAADREALRRAVLNLVLNALDAMPHGGELAVTGVDCRNGVELEIADSGPGLSDEARRRAFEPFFTTKASGIGLGLAIVYRLVESHGGNVTACNCPEGGAAFTIRLPRRAQAQEAAA